MQPLLAPPAIFGLQPSMLRSFSKCFPGDAAPTALDAFVPQAAMDEIFVLGVQLAEGGSPCWATARITELNRQLRQWSCGQVDVMQEADEAGSDGRAHLPRTLLHAC